MENKKRNRISFVVGLFLFVTLSGSVVYSFVKFLNAPTLAPEGTNQKIKTDYLLMLTQCVLGLAVMMLPSISNRKGWIQVPSSMSFLFYIFLYCSIYLGEVRCFYYYVPHWDTVLHAVSSVMLGVLGYMILNHLGRNNAPLRPVFASLFVFCFALASGAVWEMYEFAGDRLLGLNMQKTRTEDGTGLAGTLALIDTMKDIIIDAVFALFTSVYSFFAQKKRIERNESVIEYTETESSPKTSVKV